MTDTADRGGTPTYTIGGIPPYGFVSTPVYDPVDAPNVPKERPDAAVLYERYAYGLHGSNDPLYNYSNPPFLGVGSTSVSLAQWEESPSGEPHRILRGFIRRNKVYPLTSNDTNVPDDAKASNARLFFMYNPDTIERAYQSYDQASQVLMPGNDPSATAPLSWTLAQFSLLFDRAEEVATLKDHPGVLIDLEAFDLLIRNGTNGQIHFKTKQDADTQSFSMTVPSAADQQAASLQVNTSEPIVVVFSPYLSYLGTVQSASAHFEKFSHRMTPTRMTLVITMRLTAFGKEPDIVHGSLTDMANAQEAERRKAAVAPGARATKQEAEQADADGRVLAMQWAQQWLPGHATTAGVPYSSDSNKRCDNQSQDSLTVFTAPHIPNYMDCSSFVSRAYAVIGWSAALGLDACASSNDYYDVYDGGDFGDVWEHFAFSDNADTEDVRRKMIEICSHEGALLIRNGSGKAGHIAFILKDEEPGTKLSDMSHKFTVLHSGGGDGVPPSTYPITLQEIRDRYDRCQYAKPNYVSEFATPASASTSTGRTHAV